MTWEQRWHPLREEWIIVAAHRQNRPWTGETVSEDEDTIPEYDASCYLCPGNERVSGDINPEYRQTFVFDNDHPCVGVEADNSLPEVRQPYRNSPASGFARVVCYTPKHNKTLAELSVNEIVTLFQVWQQEYRDLGSHPEVNHVLIFENKGEVVGVSNPHPHCQIYATNFVFKYIETESEASQRYLASENRVLFQDIIRAEQEHGKRVIAENDAAIAFMPYFARYAYEVYVAPKKTYPSIAEVPGDELHSLASILKTQLVKYDNLWNMSFPYVMPLHQAPTDGGDHSGFHFHFEFHPPLRAPGLKKYLAGPEIGGGNFLADTDPDEKAAELKGQPDTHYRMQK